MLNILNKKTIVIILHSLIIFSNFACAMQESLLTKGPDDGQELIRPVQRPTTVEEEEAGRGDDAAASGASLQILKEKINHINAHMSDYFEGRIPREMVEDLERDNPMVKDLERAFFAGREPRFSCCSPRTAKVFQGLAAFLAWGSVTFCKTVITNGLLDLLLKERSDQRAFWVGMASLCLDGPIAGTEAARLVGKVLTKPSVVLPVCPKEIDENSPPQAWRFRFSTKDKVATVLAWVASVALGAMPASFLLTLENAYLGYALPVALITVLYYAMPYGEAAQKSLEHQAIHRASDEHGRQIRGILSASLEECERLLKCEAKNKDASGRIVNGIWEIVSEGRKAIRSLKQPSLSPFLALFTRPTAAHESPRLEKEAQKEEEPEPETLPTLQKDEDLPVEQREIIEEWQGEVSAREAEQNQLLTIWEKLRVYQEAERRDQEELVSLWKRLHGPRALEPAEHEPLLTREESSFGDEQALMTALLEVRGVSIGQLNRQHQRIAIREAILYLRKKMSEPGNRGQLEQKSVPQARERTPGEESLEQEKRLKQALRAAGGSLLEEQEEEEEDGDLTGAVGGELQEEIQKAIPILQKQLDDYEEADKARRDLEQAVFEVRGNSLKGMTVEQERKEVGEALLEMRVRLPGYVGAYNAFIMATLGVQRTSPLTYEQIIAYVIVATSALGQLYVEQSAIAEAGETVLTLSKPPAHTMGYIIATVSAIISILAEPSLHMKTIKTLQNPLTPDPYDNKGLRLTSRVFALAYAGFNTLVFSIAHYLVFQDSPNLIPSLIVVTVRMVSLFLHLADETCGDIITYMRTGSENPTRVQKLTEVNGWLVEGKEFKSGLATETLRDLLRVVSNPISQALGR